MYNFEDFKYEKTINKTLESINNDICLANENLFENELCNIDTTDFVIEAETNVNDFLKNPGGVLGDRLKEVPILGAVISKANNAKALGKIKKAEQEWKKASEEKVASEVKYWLLQDKAKKNGKQIDTGEKADETVKKIHAAYDEKIKAAEQDWSDAIEEIEDDDELQQEKKAEKKSNQAHIKADIAQKYTDKFEEIATKKMGYTPEQIKHLKQIAGDADKDLDQLTQDLEDYDTDEVKNMSTVQKKAYEEWCKVEQEVNELAAKISAAQQGGAKLIEGEDSPWNKLVEHMKAIAALTTAIKSKSADGYEEFAKSEEGKELVANAKNTAGIEKNWKNYFVKKDEQTTGSGSGTGTGSGSGDGK